MLAAAGAAVTEGPRCAVGWARTGRGEILHAMPRPREDRRPAVALHQGPHQAIEVLAAHVADRRGGAVEGAPTWPLHFLAGALPGHAGRRLTELPGGTSLRH